MTCACNDPSPFLPAPRVPLYNYEISPEGFNGAYQIPQQTVYIFPVWLCPGQRIDIATTHNAPEMQDYSIRLWLSSDILGSPLQDMPPYLKTWDANKIIPRIITVYDMAAPAPSDAVLAVPLQPCHLLVHVQNLTNFVNRFSLQIRAQGVQGA